MHNDPTVQSKRSQKGSEDVVKFLIGVGQMVWFGYKGEPFVAGEYVDCTDYEFMHMVNC